MDISAFQLIKLEIVAVLGLSKDALHIHIGIAVFLVAAAVLRKPLGSFTPWLTVVAMTVAGEVLDMRDDIASLGYWRWRAGVHDILNTLFWPTLSFAFCKARHFFRSIK
ncbi:hypothetical protein F6R98_08720 [Candidatus Methylospira mobilis]|uniref:Uncharacterized protein n=1 Tax=Candidatus Methylospira mobilis TaxID=1808979 RepID=A0A5Q0BKP9_9GAMM|nr:hypothetical protein [Candidatus Methylospira mobilis]QFY42698.1 hypothetical protein F6R98_08720 [Candidatus Methylospira mobilis]WNV04183.1 hypothetical protein RP726_17480 [Candidatus Methylospira mobilis]